MTNVFSCKTLLAFALIHTVLQDQCCPFLQVSPDFLFLLSSPNDEKDILCGVSFKRSCRFSCAFFFHMLQKLCFNFKSNFNSVRLYWYLKVSQKPNVRLLFRFQQQRLVSKESCKMRFEVAEEVALSKQLSGSTTVDNTMTHLIKSF